MPLRAESPPQEDALVPGQLAARLDECAVLLDIDGTLLDLAPTPREVWVPPGLATTLHGLLQKTSGALALVSGRSRRSRDRSQLWIEPQRLDPTGAAWQRNTGSRVAVRGSFG